MSFTLLGRSIGVETGGSPFDFEEKKGLLLSNTSQPSTLTVNPDPGAAYIHLPGKTCEEIAKYLTITFEKSLKYWLWNTAGDAAKKIITSPAYLGFTFPPAPSASNNVTIKVPFSLLNLTLDTPITKTPTSYFPCQAYTPSDDQNLDLPDVFTNQTLFAQSWSPNWTALPKAAVAQPTSAINVARPGPTTSAVAPKGPTGMSVGAKAGIGLSAAAVALLAIGVVIIFARHRRQKQALELQSLTAANAETIVFEDKPSSQFELEHPPGELGGGVNYYTYELPTATPEMGPMSPLSPPVPKDQ
ncbi:hypothetical protein BCR34DRAFT_588939 [Clohesyomyces aquaticus]|uniref:Peptidase A1 domain-containing protein n=1 Tax=Clohesyomyces aquaticus TaxID=1231657 RepID=A0A1Y1ZIA6_9PLEO|nr:hypothetical protein BCR34DRAFT_588939 [Clohesyomyces aquaticus]